MGQLDQILSFPGLTLAGIAESFLAIKLFPEYYSSQSHLSTVAVILLCNYAFGIFFWFLLYPFFFSPLRRLKGPRGFVSPAHKSLLVTDRPAGDLFLDLVKQYPGEELLGLTFRRNSAAITHPRLLADVLVHRTYDFAKPPNARNFLRHVLGDGLIIVEGDQHKFLRKNTMPAFHFRHIKELYPMMVSKADLLTNALKKEIASEANDEKGSGSGVIELSTWASKVTIDIIGIAGLGRKFNVVEKNSDPLQELYEELLEPSREKLTFAISCFVLGYDFVKHIPWKMNDVFRYLTGSLDKICYDMIREKREAITKKGDDHFDVLSLLIKSDNFSDSELKDQLLTFLAAGHETTASALTWACYLLAKHPEYQDKLRQEVAEAFPAGLSADADAAELAGTLEQMPYLNGVMNETFRLYPTVPQTMREAQRDTRIGDHFIPKGTVIVLSMWLINRMPEIWGGDGVASEFRPQRWISDAGKPNQNGGASSNYDFLTFLHGPRSCIGQGFARAEMRCLLAAMVSSFRWELAMDDAKVMPRGVITIKPQNGMYLRLTPLEQS